MNVIAEMNKAQRMVKCPTCGSTNVKQIRKELCLGSEEKIFNCTKCKTDWIDREDGHITIIDNGIRSSAVIKAENIAHETNICNKCGRVKIKERQFKDYMLHICECGNTWKVMFDENTKPTWEHDEFITYNNDGKPKIKDSGQRSEFETGAVRDIQDGKGRFDLISPIALTELAKYMEEGATKYPERNWEQGIPMHCYINSGIRHLCKYLMGKKDENHLVAALWNIHCAVHTELVIPNMQDIPNRKF